MKSNSQNICLLSVIIRCLSLFCITRRHLARFVSQPLDYGISIVMKPFVHSLTDRLLRTLSQLLDWLVRSVGQSTSRLVGWGSFPLFRSFLSLSRSFRMRIIGRTARHNCVDINISTQFFLPSRRLPRCRRSSFVVQSIFLSNWLLLMLLMSI